MSTILVLPVLTHGLWAPSPYLVFGEDHKYYLDDKHVSPSYIVPPSVESVDRAHNWFATLPMDGTEKTWIMASEISSHLGINDGGVVLAADRQSRMSMSN